MKMNVPSLQIPSFAKFFLVDVCVHENRVTVPSKKKTHTHTHTHTHSRSRSLSFSLFLLISLELVRLNQQTHNFTLKYSHMEYFDTLSGGTEITLAQNVLLIDS